MSTSSSNTPQTPSPEALKAAPAPAPAAPKPAAKSSLSQTLGNFAVGGLAGMLATCVMQPIDMIKVRVQLAGEAGTSTSPLRIASEFVKKEGFGGLYKGLDAALVR